MTLDGSQGKAAPVSQPAGRPTVQAPGSSKARASPSGGSSTGTKALSTESKGGDAKPAAAAAALQRSTNAGGSTGSYVSTEASATKPVSKPATAIKPVGKGADAPALIPANAVSTPTKAPPPPRAVKPATRTAKAAAPSSPTEKFLTAVAPNSPEKSATISPAGNPENAHSHVALQLATGASAVPAVNRDLGERPSPSAATPALTIVTAAPVTPVTPVLDQTVAPAVASKPTAATRVQPAKPAASVNCPAAATPVSMKSSAVSSASVASGGISPSVQPSSVSVAPTTSAAAQGAVKEAAPVAVLPNPSITNAAVSKAITVKMGPAPRQDVSDLTAVSTPAVHSAADGSAGSAASVNSPNGSPTLLGLAGAEQQAPCGPAAVCPQFGHATTPGTSIFGMGGVGDDSSGKALSSTVTASVPSETRMEPALAFLNVQGQICPQRPLSQPPSSPVPTAVTQPKSFLSAVPEPLAPDPALHPPTSNPTPPAPPILKLESRILCDKAMSAGQAPIEVQPVGRPLRTPPRLSRELQAISGPSRDANIVQVVLEGNPGGPCPVEVSVSALDPGGTGEVMVADLVTAAMKALKGRYGAIQAGPSVKAFFFNQVSKERRWLPTFDSIPQDLLRGHPEAGIALQGVTCSELKASHAAVVPLPGFAEALETGATAQNRVSFMSEGLARLEGTTDAVTNLDGRNPAFIQTRSLLRGISNGGGVTSMKGGARILGNGHRSVRIRTEDNTVETLSIESAAPSVTSVCSNWRGGKLPPMRGGSSWRLHSLGGGSDGGLDFEATLAKNPSRTRLLTARSSKRLAVVETAIESVGSADFERPGASMIVPAPPPVLDGAGDGVATASSAGGMGRAPLAPTPTATASPTGVKPLGVGDSEAATKKAGLAVRAEGAEAGGIGNLEAFFFPTPAADWLDLIGPDPPEGHNSQQPTGGCFACLSKFSSEAKQQQRWRSRLRTALKTNDDAELAGWLSFHHGRNGTNNQAELDTVLWLALETKSPELIKLLLRGGALPDAPRPIGPLVVPLPGFKATYGSGKVAAAKAGATGPWWSSAGTAANLDGLTPLMRAAELASPQMVELLLQSGANPAAVHRATGWTPLHRALLSTPSSASTSAWLRTRGAAVGSSENTSSAGVGAAAAGAATAPITSPKDSCSKGKEEALLCARLLLQRIGLQRAVGLITAGKHEDDLLRFAIRHGRSVALRWLLSNGFAAIVDSEEDEASCAYLAGQLGITVEVWDLQPPSREQQSPPTRDPTRPLSWLMTPEERMFMDQRRQLLMGAASAGRLDVLEMILDKPVPYDRLRRDELEAAVGACRLAQPRNQRQVEEMLCRRAHTYMAWDRELLPALQNLDVAMIKEWLLLDRPSPTEVDRALATLLSAERLAAPLWQENAAAAVNALLDAGADADYSWEADDQDEHLGVGIGLSKSLSRTGTAVASTAAAGKTLRPLLAALRAPAPAVVRQLLAAGADPRRRDENGENALIFAVRTAIRANHSADALPNTVESAPVMRLMPSSRSVSSASHGGNAVMITAITECIGALLATDHRSELLAARNDIGLSPSFLAAVADMPHLLKQLCESGGDPWAATVPAPPGAPEAPYELHLVSGTRTGMATVMAWSVGHEAARCGALSSLTALLTGQMGGSRKGHVSSETLQARKREALVGAIRGGRVGAAKIALDAGEVGAGGSLYEAELAALLALCRASASSPPLPRPPGVLASVGAADPPRYEALEAFLSSRAHVYMSWEAEVLPALRGANPDIIRRWITGDRISAVEATRGFCALVEGAQSCGISTASTTAVSPATAANDCGGVEKGVAGQLMGDLSKLSSSMLAETARYGGSAKALAEAATALIQAGADVNYQQPVTAVQGADGAAAGQTLLMQAVSRGSLPLVEVLMAAGARLDIEDAAGFTAVDVAVVARQRLGDSGSRCLGALLEPYGARRLNAHRTHFGDSALMLAVRAGDSAAVQQLLAAGAVPATADADSPASPPRPASSAAASAAASPLPPYLASPTSASPFVTREVPSSNPSLTGRTPSGLPFATTDQPSSRSVCTFPSGLARRGSAVYLAARADDREMLQTLLRSASKGDGGLDACRQEVQLGALHGGRLALLEVSLGLPELLKGVPGLAETGGTGALAAAATVCGSLAEQAAVRLGEAQGLLRELEAATAAGPVLVDGAPLASADFARMWRYLTSKAQTLEAVAGVHERMEAFYEECRSRLQGLEGVLEAKKELVSSRIRDGADAQVKLLTASTRLTASKDSLMRSVLARRDAQVGRVEAMLDRRLAGLSAALRRAEAKVSSEVEGLVMEMRKTVARRLKEIDAKKAEGINRLEALECKVDTTWARKQRLLAGRPPNVRVALNQRMSVLMQQLLAARQSLQERIDFAVTKLESQQRRGTAIVNLDGMRASLARQQQEVARVACEAAARAKMAIADRAEELLQEDKHDDLLRIVGQMQAEVTRGSANATAATSKTLGALQQAFALAEDQLAERMAQAKARMQEHLTATVSDHAAVVKSLMAGADKADLPTCKDSAPDVTRLLQGLNLDSYLEGVEGVKPGSRASEAGEADPLAYLGGLRRIVAVEDMIEDMIADMSEQVVHAFPNDYLCEKLDPAALAPLLEPPDTDLVTTGLGVERLREELWGLDLSLPNLDLVLTDIDLSPLEDDNTGAMRGMGIGIDTVAYDDSDEYPTYTGGGGGGRGGYGHGGRGGRDSDDYEYGGGGRYNAANYADRPEDDFAMSYS